MWKPQLWILWGVQDYSYTDPFPPISSPLFLFLLAGEEFISSKWTQTYFL